MHETAMTISMFFDHQYLKLVWGGGKMEGQKRVEQLLSTPKQMMLWKPILEVSFGFGQVFGQYKR